MGQKGEDGQGGKDQGGKDQGGKDQGGKDQGGKDQGGKDQGGKDQGGKDQGGKDQGGKDQGGKDQGGKKGAAEDEAAILAEFRSLWPKVLAKVHKGEKISISSAAQKVGNNQYHCAYKAQSAAGDNIRSLECLKKDIQKMKKYLGQSEKAQGGKKGAAEDEAGILAEFRSLWPKVLAKVHKGEKISITSAAQKVGDNQYHCAYKAQSATGDNIRSLECLKKDIQDMKKYLGQ